MIHAKIARTNRWLFTSYLLVQNLLGSAVRNTGSQAGAQQDLDVGVGPSLGVDNAVPQVDPESAA